MVELKVFRGYHFIEEDAEYRTKWQERIDPLMSTASTRFCSIWRDCSVLDHPSGWSDHLPALQSFNLVPILLLDLPRGSCFFSFFPFSITLFSFFFLFLFCFLFLCFFFLDGYGDVTKNEVIHDGSECHWWFWFRNHSGSPPLLLRSSLVMERLLH